MRSLFPLALSLTLIGCATTKTDVRNEAQISQYDPANSARIRCRPVRTISKVRSSASSSALRGFTVTEGSG